MDEVFLDTESLLRAILPSNRKPDFWINGHLSSAAFKDKNGLSVDRTFDRSIHEISLFMREQKRLHGTIVYMNVGDCKIAKVFLKYLPTPSDKYHSEIHCSDEIIELSDEQALSLSRIAKEVETPFSSIELVK